MCEVVLLNLSFGVNDADFFICLAYVGREMKFMDVKYANKDCLVVNKNNNKGDHYASFTLWRNGRVPNQSKWSLVV